MPDAAAPAAGKDVARPGTTPASATSKPVIVGHTSQITDPMVSAVPKPEEKPAEPAADVSEGSMKPKLTPSIEAQDAQAAANKADSIAEDADAAEAKAEEDHQNRLQEIIESGEYKVSIGQKSGKNSAATFLVTVLAIVLIGVIALFILTDLKIIDLGIKLPFHIFKQ